MVNSHLQVYIINKMMRKELQFTHQALQEGQKYLSRHPLLSSSQGPHQHLYLGIAPLLLVAVTPLIFVLVVCTFSRQDCCKNVVASEK